MFNEAHISLTGYVATQPTIKEVAPGISMLSMRVGWTPRKRDRATGEWVDGVSSFVTVICWRRLAHNLSICLRKGDPVVVKGRLSVRDWEDKAGARRTSVEIDASSVGHDLDRGVADFQRVRPPTGQTAAEAAAADTGNDAAGSAPGIGTGQPAVGGPSGRPGSDQDSDIFDEEAIAELAGDGDGDRDPADAKAAVAVPF